MSNRKMQERIAALVKEVAEKSAKNAVSKKLVIFAYEPEIPEAVKEFVNKEER